jgi:4-hydroxybenzoate polyprenyltransferase
VYEHTLVREGDLSKLNMAFFNMNGYISVAIFIFTLLDILL